MDRTGTRANGRPRTILDVSRVIEGPGRPEGAFSRSGLTRLTSSVERGNILRPVLIEEGNRGCRVITNRHHCRTDGLTKLGRVPTIIHRVSSSGMFRLTLVRGLRESSLSPVRRTGNCGRLLADQDLARRRLTGVLSGSHSTVTGALELVSLPMRIRRVVRRKLLATNRTHTVLTIPSRRKEVGLTGGIIARDLAMERARGLTPLFSIRRARAEAEITTPRSFGHTTQRLEGVLSAGIGIGRIHNGGGVRVRFGSRSRLTQVLTRVRPNGRRRHSST